MDAEKSPVNEDRDTLEKQMVVTRMEQHEIVHRADVRDDIVKRGFPAQFNGSPVHGGRDNGFIDFYEKGIMDARKAVMQEPHFEQVGEDVQVLGKVLGFVVDLPEQLTCGSEIPAIEHDLGKLEVGTRARTGAAVLFNNRNQVIENLHGACCGGNGDGCMDHLPERVTAGIADMLLQFQCR